jgi:hypothetical protein
MHAYSIAIAERDSLKAEFNDYRQAVTQADAARPGAFQPRIAITAQRNRSAIKLHIAAQAQLGPLPDMTEDSTPEARTEAHYMRLARQLKSGSTGEPTTQRIERP